jgi:LysM repeat protein
MTATIRRHSLPAAARTAPLRPVPARTVVAPNYLARRVVAAVLAVVVLAAGAVAVGVVVGALADLGGRPAAASEVPAGSPTTAVHVAAPGDTLWAIADRYRGEVGRDRYIDALVSLNGGTSIQVGQAVRLP